MKRVKIGKLGVLVCVLSVNLCAALPPQDGLEVRGGVGGGSYGYSTGGCGAPVYRNEAADLKAHARAQVHSKRDHWSATLEGSLSHSEVTSSELTQEGDRPPEAEDIKVGSQRWNGMVALRGGLHWRYGGVELGPALVSAHVLAPGDDVKGLVPMVSASAWAGVPKVLYAWGSFVEGPTSESLMPISFGVGHASDRVRATLGFSPSQEQVVGQVEVSLPIERPIWVGGMVHGGSGEFPALGGMVTVAVPLRID